MIEFGYALIFISAGYLAGIMSCQPEIEKSSKRIEIYKKLTKESLKHAGK